MIKLFKKLRNWFKYRKVHIPKGAKVQVKINGEWVDLGICTGTKESIEKLDFENTVKKYYL